MPTQEYPPGPDTPDLITARWGDRLVLHHPDDSKMNDEWLESSVFVDVEE